MESSLDLNQILTIRTDIPIPVKLVMILCGNGYR